MPSQTIRRSLVAVLFSSTSLFVGVQAAEAADANTLVAYNLPAQKLDTALRAVATQGDLQIMFSDADVAGVSTAPLNGTYSPLDAIRKLLAGTSLTFSFNGDDTVVVRQDEDGTSTATADSDGNTFVLEEIIVTAEKRAESLQDIPIAISAHSGDDLEKASVYGYRELQMLTPSLQFTESGANVRISIRGVGSELTNVGNELGVVASQDGVPFVSHFMLNANFLDVERIEVLRGPQGTIAGRNATGGAINIHSQRPTEELEVGIKATFGNYDRLDLEGHVSGPLAGDRLLGRLSVRTQRSDGWLTNTLLDEDRNDTDMVQARAVFLANFGDDIETNLVLERTIDRSSPTFTLDFGRARSDVPSAAEAAGVPESTLNQSALTYQADYRNIVRLEDYKAIFGASWNIDPSTTLTSTTGYVSFEKSLDVDGDGIAAPLTIYNPVDVNVWQFSQELTLTADITDRLDLIVGGIYLRAELGEPISIGSNIFLDAVQDLESYGVYAQLRFRPMDDIRITLGGRYTKDQKDYVDNRVIFGNSSSLTAGGSWDAFTPRLAVEYTPTDDHTLYASVSRGFKSGGINTFSPIVFNPEFVWSYEMGVKSIWLGRRARTALTGFYMDYTDLQQAVTRLSPVTGSPRNEVENAGAATISGLEFELEAEVFDHFRLSANGTWYIDAKYKDLTSIDPAFLELGLQDLEGNRLTRVPDWQFSLGGQYAVPLTDGLRAVFRANYQWQNRIFFSIFNTDLNARDSLGLLNVSAALETDDGHWQLSAFATNLLNKRYASNLSAVPRASGFSLQGAMGAPRMYGVSLAYNF